MDRGSQLDEDNENDEEDKEDEEEEEDEAGGGRQEAAIEIKSNNPHLVGGEKEVKKKGKGKEKEVADIFRPKESLLA